MDENRAFFEKDLSVGTSGCDISGVWKLSSFLKAMQDTANEHCQRIGADRNSLSAAGFVWFLVKTDISIERYPSCEERITVQTFTKENKYIFYPRYYQFLDEAGRIICKAGSLWVLINKVARTAVSPKDSGVYMPDAAGMESSIRIRMMPGKTIEGDKETGIIRPLYSELDINGHVNNVRYADWLCNTLGTTCMRAFEVETLLIDYNHEILPEMSVSYFIQRNKTGFVYSGTVDEKRLFNISGTLRERRI